MIHVAQLESVLDALPDPAFVLSRSGKYVAVFGGRDIRYYHDGTGLIGLNIADVVKQEKADWFLARIAEALASRKLLIVEYELSNKDVKGLDDDGPQDPIWFEGRIQAMDFLVDEEAVVLWVASNISARHLLERQLRELSDTDQLTGLFNRRKLEHDLANHYAAWQQQAVPTAILIFDLDNLKLINDTQGHYAGDEIIQTVANICRAALRETDTVCRFGGDEFVVAMPNTGREQALQFAEHLQDRLRQALRQFTVGDTIVSASMGVTVIEPEDRSYEETLKRADRALYRAKSLGKDKVVPA